MGLLGEGHIISLLGILGWTVMSFFRSAMWE